MPVPYNYPNCLSDLTRQKAILQDDPAPETDVRRTTDLLQDPRQTSNALVQRPPCGPGTA